jgi:hypothetical protein
LSLFGYFWGFSYYMLLALAEFEDITQDHNGFGVCHRHLTAMSAITYFDQ